MAGVMVGVVVHRPPSASLGQGVLQAGLQRPLLLRSGAKAPRLTAAVFRRTSRATIKRCCRAVASASSSSSSSGFAELKRDAESDYRKARDLLPLLETARQTASHARGPARDSESIWQESHRRLSTLHEEIGNSTARLRSSLVETAGGDAAATAHLVQHHVHFRMQRVKAQLEPKDWQEFEIVTMPLPIAGAQFFAQVAAYQVGERYYAAACFATGGPFLNNNVQSMLLHWATCRGGGTKWEQPPPGFQTSPPASHASGGRAWQTPFSAHVPVLDGVPVEEAAVLSIVLQMPLEGPLEKKGGGLPFVLKRTDGGKPEWVKRDDHHDFVLPLDQAIEYFREKAEARAAPADGAAGGKSGSSSPRQEWFHSWGLDDWDWGRALAAVVEHRISQDGPKGWLSQIKSWEEVPDFPRPTPEPSVLLQRLRPVAAVLAQHGAGPLPGDTIHRKGGAIGSRTLLQQCRSLEGALKELDAAELAAATAQRHKEQLHEVFTRAEATATQLKQEISSTLESARRSAVRLRGRETEITQRDMEILAAQLAEEMSKAEEEREQQDGKGRQLVFLQQSVMRLAQVEGQVLVQTYLEGPKSGSQSDEEDEAGSNGHHSNGSTSEGGRLLNGDAHRLNGKDMGAAAEIAVNGAVNGAANGAAQPTFDSLLVSVVVGEDFPDNGLSAPLVVHWAGVPHEGGGWIQPPEGWGASAQSSRREGSATQTPLQRHVIAADGGAPVLVDPSLYGACIRLPLRGCKECRVQGLEFVFKGRDGAWLQRQQPGGRASNFFAELPRVV